MTNSSKDESSSATTENFGDEGGGDEQDGLLHLLNQHHQEELDSLDFLAGDFKVQASKLMIEAVIDGKKLPSDDWEYLKSCFSLPKLLTKVIERTKVQFSIVELKNGQRD